MSNEATSLATTLQVFDEDGWYHGRRVGPVLEKMREKQGKLTLSTTTAPQQKSAIFKRGWKLRSSILVCLLGRLQDGQAQLSAGPRADTSHGARDHEVGSVEERTGVPVSSTTSTRELGIHQPTHEDERFLRP